MAESSAGDMLTTRTRHERFEDFYRTHRQPIAHALAITLRNRELGEEAADEGMVRAFERWRQVVTYDNQPGWVYRVGLNYARDRLRKTGRERDLGVRDAAWDERPSDDPSLDDMVRALPLEYRAVVVLRYFLDWQLDEIAAALDVPIGTVKSRLNRAHRRLAPALEELR